MQLHQIKSPKGSRTTKRIVGRGPGSGRGKTSGRGHKGQGSRAGRVIMRGSEGGQMALIRRLPKFGFTSHRPVIYQIVKLEQLSKAKEGTVVDAKYLVANGLIKNAYKPYKILANGEVKKPLTCQAYSFSKSAEEKIVKAGGKVEIVDAQIIKGQLKTETKK